VHQVGLGEDDALTAEITGTQALHGFICLHAQGGQGLIEEFPFSSDIVNTGFRTAIVTDLINPFIHFRDEHMQIFDVGQEFFLSTAGKLFHFANDVIHIRFPGGEFRFHGFTTISDCHHVGLLSFISSNGEAIIYFHKYRW
jgi:hypothetical protein